MSMRKRSFLLSVCSVALARGGASSFMLVQRQDILCFAVQRASFFSPYQAKSDEEEEKGEAGAAFFSPYQAKSGGEEEKEEGAAFFSPYQAKSDEEEEKEEEAEDTIRVRIWRALAGGDELSLSQLGQAVGERRLGELRSHLSHVERQSKTLRNKSDDWKVRRGLLPDAQSNDNDPSPFASKAKVRLKRRKGKKNEILVKLA